MADSAPRGPVARLCSKCEQAMVIDYQKKYIILLTEFFFIDHLPDLIQLRDSAQQGCDFCRFLRALILMNETRDSLHSDYQTDIASLGSSEVKITVNYRLGGRDLLEDTVNNYLVVNVDFGSDIRYDYWNSLNSVEGHDGVAKHFGLTKSLSQSYSDTETIQWLRSCISACEEHEHSASKSNYFPERLLDITDGKVRLVLHESLDIGSSGLYPEYAALSYCWGTSEDARVQLKTTLSSLAERQAGIQREDLQTVPALQDAVRISRELGISYLWIDSLCILQDDISDWDRNSSNMDKVYGSAKVTLVAAASRSCRESFLQVKGQQLLLPLQSTTHPALRGLMQLQFKFISTGEIGKMGKSREVYVDFHNTPLSRRGWTVQERLLAARQIVFGPCNVHFTCLHGRQSRGSGLQQKSENFAMSDTNNKNTSVLYRTWLKVVSEFSHITTESFTNPSDLLPAISGLAHYFNRRFQDDYCAGHWKKELLISLMWFRFNRNTISKETHLYSHRSPIPYLVPSWSYLFKGQLRFFVDMIRYDGDRLQIIPSFTSDAPEVEYLDWERCLLRNDPMGALSSAKLKIKSRVMSLPTTKTFAIKHHHPGRPPPPENQEEQEWEIVSGDQVGTGSFSLNICLDYNSTKANVGSDVLEWKWVMLGSCSMLPLYSSPPIYGSHESYEDCRYPYGLLVARLWEDKEEWCRIGVFTARNFSRFTLDHFKQCSEVESITIL